MPNTKRNTPGGMHPCCTTRFGDAGGMGLGRPLGGGGGVTNNGNTTQHYNTPNLVAGGGGCSALGTRWNTQCCSSSEHVDEMF